MGATGAGAGWEMICATGFGDGAGAGETAGSGEVLPTLGNAIAVGGGAIAAACWTLVGWTVGAAGLGGMTIRIGPGAGAAGTGAGAGAGATAGCGVALIGAIVGIRIAG